jgi:hypothetical protein
MSDWSIEELLDWLIRNHPEVAKSFYYHLAEEE